MTSKPCQPNHCAALATGFLRKPCPQCPLRSAPIKTEEKQ